MGKTIPASSSSYSKIEPLLRDAIGRKTPTYIEYDNVLIFGKNSTWNQNVAKTLVDAFHGAGRLAVIVRHEKFLSLSLVQKRFGKSKNIVICNDVYLAIVKFSILKKNTRIYKFFLRYLA